tara:strand:- start:814 stop:1128 length:315 start_codon:yes stop_codon:yes gene_type:complete
MTFVLFWIEYDHTIRRLTVMSTGITRVFTGGAHTFAINDNNGQVWTWGLGAQGRLGLNSENSVAVPTQLEMPWQGKGLKKRIVTIVPAVDHNLMVAEDLDEQAK